MSGLGHVSGVTGWIILFPVTSLTLYLVIPSYPELSSHTRRRMGRPGQRQPPESRSVRVHANHWSEHPPGHQDGVQGLFELYYDARIQYVNRAPTQCVWIATVQSIVETDGEKGETKTFVTH